MGLRRAGYSVDVVGNATEARQLLEGQPYALVIADWRLPDGNGIDLGGKLMERHSAIHVAIMTGAELSRVEGEECGKCQFDVVNKPFLPQQIIDLVRERIKSQAKASA